VFLVVVFFLLFFVFWLVCGLFLVPAAGGGGGGGAAPGRLYISQGRTARTQKPLALFLNYVPGKVPLCCLIRMVIANLITSVADPDPNPDPHVFLASRIRIRIH
jgi:hypothetical protein